MLYRAHVQTTYNPLSLGSIKPFWPHRTSSDGSRYLLLPAADNCEHRIAQTKRLNTTWINDSQCQCHHNMQLSRITRQPQSFALSTDRTRYMLKWPKVFSIGLRFSFHFCTYCILINFFHCTCLYIAKRKKENFHLMYTQIFDVCDASLSNNRK